MTLLLHSARLYHCCLLPALHYTRGAAAGKAVKECRRKLQSAGTGVLVQTDRALVPLTSLSWLLTAEPTLWPKESHWHA